MYTRVNNKYYYDIDMMKSGFIAISFNLLFKQFIVKLKLELGSALLNFNNDQLCTF